MKKKEKLPTPPGKEKKKENPEGYPLYPDRDDIYKKFHEDKDINPEDRSRLKRSNPDDEIEPGEELDLDDDVIHDSDLDVPGSELDDDGEEIGSEDEENNYYSIGGDRHEDLEEDNGE